MSFLEKVKWHWRLFDELSPQELYEVLDLRQRVFIVEQQSIYRDTDGFDRDSLHLLAKYNEQIIAYVRVIRPEREFSEASFGRMVSDILYRGKGLGKLLAKYALEKIDEEFGDCNVRIKAETYLTTFYENFGFERCGQPFNTENVEFVEMLKRARS